MDEGSDSVDPDVLIYDVFLSHASEDTIAVEVIGERLRDQRGLAPFLDSWHLKPGVSWQNEIALALDNSSTAAVFIGPSGVNPWHNEELRVAMDRAVRTSDEFRVIPVLLPGADASTLPRFLAQRTWADFRDGLDDDIALDRLVAGIRGEALVDGAYELPDEPAPYRGLLKYEKSNSDIFFGREAETAQLVSKLQAERFMAVVGASGSGKSSLVRAGLLPALADGAIAGSADWNILILTPGSDALRSLAEQVGTLNDGGNRLTQVDELVERFTASDDGLKRAIRTLAAPENRPSLIVIDQFEELFTLCVGSAEECLEIRGRFLNNVAAAIEDLDSAVRVVITLRADFMDEALSSRQLKELLQDRQVLLGALGDEALREAIVRPAQAVGAFFEKGLVQTILRDVATEPGMLPLLQHALYELWRRRRGPWLTLDAYEETGGVTGALRRRAQATYDSLSPSQQDIARHIFVRLTTFGDGVADTRRRVNRSELYPATADPSDVELVLHTLSAESARLIVTEKDTVEVAHETLLQQWDTLRGWLDEDRDGLRVHRDLTQAAREWSTTLDRDPDALYRGSRLAQADEWAPGTRVQLSAIEAEFLEASRQRARSELDDERKMNLRLRRRLAVARVALAVAVLGVVGALWALNRANNAESEAQYAQSESRVRELAASSKAILTRDGELAGLLAIESADSLPEFSNSQAVSYAALYGFASYPLSVTMSGHSDHVFRAHFSRDGSQVVTASADGTARVWGVDGSSQSHLVSGSKETVFAADLSPDGSIVVTASGETATLWESTGRFIGELPGHSGIVNTAEFDSTGSLVLTASGDGTARIWQTDGSPGPVLTGHGLGINHATFSSDASMVAVANGDGTAQIFLVDGSQVSLLEGEHVGNVQFVEFSPDGAMVVTAGQDGNAKVWTVDGELVASLEGHDDSVNSARFSADGTQIVTAGRDGTARVWNISGKEISKLSGHTNSVLTAAFSPDGRQVITASFDGTARLWAADGTAAETLTDRGHVVWWAEFNHDGTAVLTASDDGVAQIWEPAGSLVATVEVGRGSVQTAVFSPHQNSILTAASDPTADLWALDGTHLVSLAHDPQGQILSIGFSPDGAEILTAGEDGTARVWGTDGQVRAVLTGHNGPVRAAVFSPDGDTVGTAGADSDARLWDVDGTPGPFLRGHTGAVHDVQFSPDGSQILTASRDGTARLWALDGTAGPILAGHSADVLSAVFNSGGSKIVTASFDGTARLWDADGSPGPVLDGQGEPVLSARFNPAGDRVVTATASLDGVALIWDLDGNLVGRLDGHSGIILSANFSPDGGRIVTASLDDTARVWAANGTLLAVLEGHEEVHSAVFSADGTLILTTGKDGTARVWESWSFDEALVAVQELVGDGEFTSSECVQYAIDPCPADS